MQINLKSFLLKNETFYAEFRPFPISKRVKQRTMPSDHAEKAYGNMQMNSKFLPVKKIMSFPLNSVYLPFQPTRSIMITIAVRMLNFVYRNMQMNLKSYLLKNQTFSAEFRPSPISTRVKQRSMPSDHAKKAYGNMQMNLKFFLIKNQVFSAEFRLFPTHA